MSHVTTEPTARPTPGPGPVHQLLPGRRTELGPRGMLVDRALPNRDRRMIGAWCFTDRFGPTDVADGPGMRVPPHPHTGLQTVTWLLSGEVLHRDSLGTARTIRPGQLNLMTAGHGLAHSEQSVPGDAPLLHGVQLWVALPAGHRNTRPRFEHHAALPQLQDGGIGVTVLVGELAGLRSPATTFGPLVGAQVTLDAGTTAQLPMRPDFEHGVLVLSGAVEVDGVVVEPGPLLYLGGGRDGLTVRSDSRAALLLLGGEPFTERLVMWWNFVGADHDDVVTAREDWMAGRRFGVVEGFDGDPLPAPTMPTTPLRPRGRVRWPD
jgi:redox-sensitive bicupin YhaK (pirin superfamily)